MKTKLTCLVALAALSVLLSACIYRPIGSYPVRTVYSPDVVWAEASYDSSGFPIFGYSYGRPIYGYTISGAAIYNFGALTARCYVPQWQPAHWYHGTWIYPRHIVRVSAPPQYPQGHQPNVRPPANEPTPVRPAK